MSKFALLVFCNSRWISIIDRVDIYNCKFEVVMLCDHIHLVSRLWFCHLWYCFFVYSFISISVIFIVSGMFTCCDCIGFVISKEAWQRACLCICITGLSPHCTRQKCIRACKAFPSAEAKYAMPLPPLWSSAMMLMWGDRTQKISSLAFRNIWVILYFQQIANYVY